MKMNSGMAAKQAVVSCRGKSAHHAEARSGGAEQKEGKDHADATAGECHRHARQENKQKRAEHQHGIHSMLM